MTRQQRTVVALSLLHCGLALGDVLVAIDGELTAGKKLDDVRRMLTLASRHAQVVTLTVRRWVWSSQPQESPRPVTRAHQQGGWPGTAADILIAGHTAGIV